MMMAKDHHGVLTLSCIFFRVAMLSLSRRRSVILAAFVTMRSVVVCAFHVPKRRGKTLRTFYHFQKRQQCHRLQWASFLSSTSMTTDNCEESSRPDVASSSSKTTTKLQMLDLDASRLGLDPARNRFHAPLVYHENYSFPDWPEKHTFPMDKFARLAHALTHTSKKTHPESSPLPRPLVASYDHFFRPLDVPQVLEKNWLLSSGHDDSHSNNHVLDAAFVQRFLQGQLSSEECRAIGFRDQTHRPELIQRTILEVAGTVLACQLAIRYGIAANVAGGTHHARRDRGAGYTILNDAAVAAHQVLHLWQNQNASKQLRQDTLLPNSSSNRAATANDTTIQRVLVVDCDVHQGDGTATFSTEEGSILKDKLFTLSLHCASNYPHVKAKSTMDVGLPDGMRDDDYLHILQKSLEQALEQVQPDLVLYNAGVDIYEHDFLGRLKVTEAGIRKRDRHVLDKCVTDGIPVAAVIGGGYDKDLDALARRHAIVHEEAAYVWRKHKLWTRA